MTYPTPTSVGGAANIGMVTPDHAGSYEEWYDRVVGDLVTRFVSGEGGEGWADPSFSSPWGRPDANDYGNPEGTVSWATVNFVENYVTNEAANSPYITSTYGAPPTRHATYVQDPNSASSVQGTYAERAADQARENALNRERDLELQARSDAAANYRAELGASVEREGIASRERIAGMQEAGATQRTQMQIDASWREAQLADATRRYIAEGDWAVQKWVVETQEAGALERLQLQLDFEREALAQEAVAEANRHQENMIGLALEVAKYDAELASNPANLYAYAAWLQNRNIVVNGMTLAMAQQEVPIQAIDPAEVANTTGDNIAGLAQQQALVTGASGGSAQPTTPEQLQEIIAGATGAPAGTTAQQLAGGAIPQQQPSPSAEQLGASTDYGALANQLLGLNPLAPNEADTSQQNLQAIASGLNVGGNAQTPAGFGAYGGPRTNALGVEIPQVTGQEVDYRKFTNLLPTEQQGVFAGVKSLRGQAGQTDFIAEMERSRPKGKLSGRTTFA